MQHKTFENVDFHFAQFGQLVQTLDFVLPLLVYIDSGRRFGKVSAIELHDGAVSFEFFF